MTNTEQEYRQPIEVQMFGGFRITVGEHSIGDTDTRTRQLWLLLQYLVTFRHKTLSQEEIIKVMWPENDIENPANALKNLVYRIRVTFTEWEIPYARDMIIYHQGSYQWNNNIPCEVDVEEFEAYCHRAENSARGEEYQLDQYRQALNLYRGDFLPSSSDENWVVPISSYLRTLFFKSVYAKLDILRKQDTRDAYENIILTCRRTLIIDPLEEAIHRHLIYALYKTGRQAQAIEHYQAVTQRFYKELGIGPSEAMLELFQEISQTTKSEIDISELQADLRETGRPEGAFYCEYEIFKNLYRLEARTAARTGQSMFISMLSVEHIHGTALPIETQGRVMDTLKTSIETSLRKGDVFSRFSPSQYALMIPTGTYENCEMVMDRILSRFRQLCRIPEAVVRVRILPLEPAV